MCMKKSKFIASFFAFTVAFFICLVIGASNINAGDCKSSVSSLNSVKCAYTNKIEGLSYVSEANRNLYKTQAASAVSLNKESVVAEGYPAGTAGSLSSSGSPYNTDNGYKAWDSNYPNIKYYYGVHDKKKKMLGGGATNIIRGTNAIIFPAVEGKTAYNKAQYYRVCEKKRMWGLFGCKTWSSYKLGKEAYHDPTGKKKDGKAWFDDLSDVTMVLPSFQINLSRSDYNSSTKTYNIAGFDRRFDLVSSLYYIGKDKYVYNANGGIQRVIGGRGTSLDDNAVLHNYYKSQAVFNTLVMEYQTKIYYYYLVGSCSNGLCKVQKAVANAKVYVEYATSSSSGYFAALNGWHEDEGGAATGVSLIPIHYDVSMILDPSNWTSGSCSSSDQCTEMFIRESVKNGSSIKTFGGNSVVVDTTQTGAIKVRAMGLDTDSSVNNVMTLDVTGEFYYENEVELVEGLTAYVTANGKTHNITSQLGKAYYGQPNEFSLNRTWGASSNEMLLEIYPGGFDVSDLKVYKVEKNHFNVLAKTVGSKCSVNIVNASSAKTICDGVSLNATKLSSQKSSTKDGKKVYTLRLKDSEASLLIAVMEMKASGEQLYVPLAYDPVSPKDVRYRDSLLDGKYVVATSVDDAKTKPCIYIENVASMGDSCEIILYNGNTKTDVDPNYIQFKYTDWIGLSGESSKYQLIVDDKDPDLIQGEITYESKTESLDGSVGDYSVDLNIPTFTLEFLNFDQTLYTINGVFSDIENHEDFKDTLANLGMYEVLLTNPRARGVVKIKATDPGVYGDDSSGIDGLFYKMWNVGEESLAEWSYHDGDTYEITGLTGDTYVAVMAVDNAKRFYNPTGGTGVFIRVYKISMYSIPYVNEVIATEQGLAFVVRDDLNVYSDPGITTTITKMAAVNKEAGTTQYDLAIAGGAHEQEYFNDVLVLNYPTYEGGTPILLSKPFAEGSYKELTRASISYDEESSSMQYLNTFTGTYFDYQKMILSNNIQNMLNNSLTIDIEASTFDNMMLINGLLLNGNAQLYIEYTVSYTTPGTAPVIVYQLVSMPNSMMDETQAKAFSFYNENTDHEISSVNDVLAITGNDYNSRKDGDNFILNYKYYTYYSQEPIEGTLSTSADGLYYVIAGDHGELYTLYKSFYSCTENDGVVTCTVNEGQYNIYYKVCYETEGSFGATVSCHGDRYLYKEETGVILGKINENVVYHVYTAIMTGVVWDVASNQLVAKYNNDESGNYRVVTPNENIINSNRVIDGEYEIDYCRFLYATAIPEITVEYETMNEYNPDAINKLKDPGWVVGSKNYIIKVTLNYEVDKFKKDPDTWMKLTADDIMWFGYYEATGRSVCGNVDRMDCDISMTSFGLYDANPRSTEYTPRVYYLQYPTTEDINEFNPAYSIDVFDLVIKLKGNNGLTNEGMDLVVDDVVREENKDFLTIYYDQDGPKITITSSPDKDPSYYAVSINAKDVSSNVAKVSFYYGKIVEGNELDPEVFLLYEETVNKKEFSGYSAKLTQKGWYTVVAEDEFGQKTYYSFEVVKLEDGVMFSPTLDDTDQIQDSGEDETKVVVTIIATVVTLFVVALVLAILIVALVIYIKYRRVIKTGKKVVRTAKPIAKYTKNVPGWVGAASKVVDAIPDELVEETPQEKAEDQPPQEGHDDNNEEGE